MKYRKHIISCFRRSCILHKCYLREVEIMPDHVHLFVSISSIQDFNIKKLIQHLKGWSSFSIRKQNQWMKKKYKAFWSPSYFIESIGHISESVIRKYIKNQTTHMKSSYKYKSLVRSKEMKCKVKLMKTTYKQHYEESTSINTYSSSSAKRNALVQNMQGNVSKCKRSIQHHIICSSSIFGHTKISNRYNF